MPYVKFLYDLIFVLFFHMSSLFLVNILFSNKYHTKNLIFASHTLIICHLIFLIWNLALVCIKLCYPPGYLFCFYVMLFCPAFLYLSAGKKMHNENSAVLSMRVLSFSVKLLCVEIPINIRLFWGKVKNVHLMLCNTSSQAFNRLWDKSLDAELVNYS